MLINIFDVRRIARHTATQLERAGHTVNIHEPMNRISDSGREFHHPQTITSMGDSLNKKDVVERALTYCLQSNRALWLVPSVSASVVGRDMLDLCGNSSNIIFCEPPLYNTDKIIGSSLTIDHTRRAQQIARIRGNDIGHQYSELVADDGLIHLCDLALQDSMFRDNARIRFKEATKGGAYLASSVLVAYANYFGFSSQQRPDYVQMVAEFVAKRNA